MRSTLDGLGSGVSLVRYEAVQLPFLAQARVQIILRPKSRTAAETEDPGEAHTIRVAERRQQTSERPIRIGATHVHRRNLAACLLRSPQ